MSLWAWWGSSLRGISPLSLSHAKVAPALAAGCAVVIRPSREVPGTAMLLVDCLRQAGIPAGVVNMVHGPIAATYGPIMKSRAVRKISLTGSTAVGQQMIRDSAATLKRGQHGTGRQRTGHRV